MSDKRKREFMEKLDSCYSVVQQSSSKGISAREIAEKLGIHRTTVHSYLNSLELMGKVYSEHGLWYAKDVKEDSIKEKEIELTIELPVLDEDEREYEARLSALAEDLEHVYDLPITATSIKNYLKSRKESRTIKIKGKNIKNVEEIKKLIIETLKQQSKSKPFWKRKKFLKI